MATKVGEVAITSDSQAGYEGACTSPTVDIYVQDLLPLIRSVATKIARRARGAVEIDDLVQEGVLGLLDALPRYRPEKGPLAAFARPRITGAMLDSLRKGAWPRRLRAMRRQLTTGGDATPSRGQLFRLSVLERMAGTQDSPRDQDVTWLPDALQPVSPVDPYERLRASQTNDRVRHALIVLPPRERRLVRLYYGQDATQAQIARTFGVGESRIYQIHQRLLGRLKPHLSPDLNA